MTKFAYKRRDIKIIVSGDIVELIQYRVPVNCEKRDYEIVKGSKNDLDKKEENLQRARSNIRRYIWQNVTPYSKFITLTYKDTVLDYEILLYDMKQFFKNLGRAGYCNKNYLWIMEHQIERGKKEGNAGSLHSHCILFNDEYIPFDAINKAWGKGNTDIHKLNDINNVGAYVSKYLTKETYSEFNRHSYHISRGLQKPTEYCHDGYITDVEFGKEILDQVDWYHMHTTNYEYDTSNGKFQNSIIYKQGRLRNGRYMQEL